MSNVIDINTHKRADRFGRMTELGDNMIAWIEAEAERLGLDMPDAIFAALVDMVYMVEEGKDMGIEELAEMHDWLGRYITNPEQFKE